MRMFQGCLRVLIPLFVLAVASGCGGGSRGTSVTQYPKWNFEAYQRVAVLPAKTDNRKAEPEADTLTEQLVAALTSNGTFTVLSRGDLKDVLTEQDLSRLADAADPATALPEGRITIAQALIIPRITQFDLVRERQEKIVKVPVVELTGSRRLDRAGRIVFKDERVELFRHAAIVGGSVKVIDAATGKTLLAHTCEPIVNEESRRNAPPNVTPEQMAAVAVRELAKDFYKNIAPIEIRVKLKSKMLIVATDYFDGQYEDTSTLDPSIEEFLIAVRDLPGECDRNDFRVGVAAKDGRANLVEHEFVWSGTYGPKGWQIKFPMKPLRDSGALEFVAKLYSGRNPTPILTRDFELAETK